jgi:hypothetical protein
MAIIDKQTPGHSVGYGRPPVHARFQEGRSGNPKGRPRGARNTTTIITEALNERVVVKENGKTRKITKREAMFKQVVNKAASGDLKSLQFVAGLLKVKEDSAPTQDTATASAWSTPLSDAEKGQWQSTLKGLFAAGLTPEDLGISPHAPDSKPAEPTSGSSDESKE